MMGRDAPEARMRIFDELPARIGRTQKPAPRRDGPEASPARPNAAPHLRNLDQSTMLELQRTAGNAAVTSLLAGDRGATGERRAPRRQEVGAPKPRIDLGAFAFGRPSMFAALADKSETENEAEEQDQTIDVGTFAERRGGVRIVAEVSGGFNSPDFPDGLKFTQTIETNAPLRGASSPYVDPHPKDDAKPFYWTDAQQQKYPTTFKDHPWRYPPTGSAAKFWQGTLALNGVDEASRTVTGLDYITYGFILDAAGNVKLNFPANVDGEHHRQTLAGEWTGWTFD
jgi:hypothetical protein